MMWLFYDFDAKAGFLFFFFFQAEDGIRDLTVTGVQTCALPIYAWTADPGCVKTRVFTQSRPIAEITIIKAFRLDARFNESSGLTGVYTLSPRRTCLKALSASSGMPFLRIVIPLWLIVGA